MAKPRTQFTRLGAHTARDTAREVRKRAAAAPADPAAQKELEALNKALSPERLRAKVWEIVRNHLADSDGILGDAGGGPPRAQGRASNVYAAALLEWAGDKRGTYDFDSPEGRAVEIVSLCASIAAYLDTEAPVFRLGVVLGYGLAQKNHLLVREFADGPALAREAAAQKTRAEGGRARAAQSADRDKQMREDFSCALAKDSTLTRRHWAEIHAADFELSADRVRKIVTATKAPPQSKRAPRN